MKKIITYIIAFVFCTTISAQVPFFLQSWQWGTVYNSTTGETWMDRNLGASRVATSSNDALSYGDLYQWGRLADGHESRTSSTTATLSSTDTPGHDDFIINNSSPRDWRDPQNDNLWQGVSGTNNPCPDGFRLPTEAEWTAEIATWDTEDAAGAYGSVLKLSVAGRRGSLGAFSEVGSIGNYCSSTISSTLSRCLRFSSTFTGVYDYYRVNGLSVRCIKD